MMDICELLGVQLPHAIIRSGMNLCTNRIDESASKKILLIAPLGEFKLYVTFNNIYIFGS